MRMYVRMAVHISWWLKFQLFVISKIPYFILRHISYESLCAYMEKQIEKSVTVKVDKSGIYEDKDSSSSNR